ncbi:MAG: VTC domain-containing protein [Kordiimonadaceae bacterium]|jgi:hypothetical protein|nr:VTC domain-containing protein [Kordiimonadaceae bacterium]MBT6036474.1 VTC domain-containing protein [Kordiimonadaceae bacterium]MBT6329379.1 VTC domain-containing protein [Kordiimonadaceae bacterium]
MRYEIKFVLKRNEYNQFKNWLLSQAFARKMFPNRTVSSIYFDTIDFECARDNLAGVGHRTKMRLRWYPSKEVDLKDQTYNFEFKKKSGRLGSKETIKMDAFNDSLSSMSAKSLDVQIRKNPNILERSPYGRDIKSVLSINYLREYYSIGKGIRITIDSDLEFGDIGKSKDVSSARTRKYENKIVEFKFPPELREDFSRIARTLPFYPRRNSKYLLGLALTDRAVYI